LSTKKVEIKKYAPTSSKAGLRLPRLALH